LSKRLIKTRRHLVQFLLEQVSVVVERHGDRRMPKMGLHFLRLRSIGDQQGGTSVSKPVDSELRRQAPRLQRRQPNPTPEVLCSQWSPLWRSEHQSVGTLVGHCRQMLGQQIPEERRNPDMRLLVSLRLPPVQLA